jgi:hypothetical protein
MYADSAKDRCIKTLPALALIILTGIYLASCARTMPIYNVSSAPVAAPSGPLSTAQVRAAIIDALHDKGWTVRQDNPGRVEAEVLVRTHRADVEIDYSATQYSITYKGSENLLYDGSTIHRNYNKWIVLLERQINQRFSEA